MSLSSIPIPMEVDSVHLLGDLAKMYDSGTEMVVSEAMGNAVDVEATKLQELSDAIKDSMENISLNKKFKELEEMEVLRVTCVGRNYDSELLKEESRDEVMEELDTEYLFDLILEKDDKYSVLTFEY